MEFLSAYNGVLIRYGLYLLIFWPTVGYYVYKKSKEQGLSRRVVHFKLEGRRIAREGTPVIDGAGQTVGEVLSGTLSPVLGCPIGSAIVRCEVMGQPLFVDLRGHQLALQLAKPPLHV